MSLMNIELMKTEHLKMVAEIEEKNFTTPWSFQSFEKALERNDTIYFVCILEGQVVGYCGAFGVLDEGEITNVSVHPKFQGRGIGRALLETLLIEGENRTWSIYFLEVRQSNERAIRLYQSLGFEKTGIRPNFYQFPKEHGVLMRKQL